MLAVRWHGNRDVRLEEVELELPLGPGMLEAEVQFCGICGSDVAEFAQGPFAIRERPHILSGQEPPVTLGHEFSARITAVGPGVEGFELGDRISVDACWRCNACEACASGDYNRCLSSGSIGLCSDGGFAERVRFPSYAAVRLPDSVSDRAGALLEPLAVGLHALDRGSAKPGERVIVLGFGAIGAATAVIGRAIGLEVLVSEPNDGRRARASEFGFAVHQPSGNPRDDARELRARTGGGAEVLVDATGSATALEEALDMTRRGARIVLVGLPKTPSLIPASKLVFYERAIVGSLGYVHDLPRVATLMANGAFEPEQLITRTVPLSRAPDEIARLADDPGSDIKVLVEIGGSA